MAFIQSPPQLGNLYSHDPPLRGLLRQSLPSAVLAECESQLLELGELGAGELYRMQLDDRLDEPQLQQWDAWGNRIDRVRVSALWQRAEALAARHGLVAEAYERTFGRHSRLVQFAKIYLFAASTDVYCCPLAMTDGAARALLDSGNEALIERALPHLTSRDAGAFWTSGQWMTESSGGSDVGTSTTLARQDASGRWRLYGRKWFTSAAASQMALTLARPEGNPAGGRGLALFYLETRTADGTLNGMRINRLKDKLGTRKVPTAEIELEGTYAEPVRGLDHGVRHIAPMLNITRAWNAIVAVALMRRGIALALDYAARRSAFGARLIEQPLHGETLAALETECRGALHLTCYVAELIGRAEAAAAGEEQLKLLRVLTPVAKALTGRQAVAVLSEVAEAFGGAGYIEDCGVALLVRDAHVLPIWEGTTNVLALDALRLLADGGFSLLRRELGFVLGAIRSPALVAVSARIEAAFDAIAECLHRPRPQAALEADARRIALGIGRGFAAALLARHAQWAEDNDADRSPAFAARRFVEQGLFPRGDSAPEDSGEAIALLGSGAYRS
ncbi:MAG: acyl-CoA dehydrogenase family protein [Burkholderiales bacterium]|nr:acyl-CoA dehydrogenase family protein [Burkholderiales bacterium]